MTRTLTESEVEQLWKLQGNANGSDGPCGNGWDNHSKRAIEGIIAFAQSVLAKFGGSSDERAIRERERAAWEAGFDYRGSQLAMGLNWRSFADAERDRRYPLPQAEPAPVLTDDEVALLSQGYSDPRSFVRGIESFVLGKLRTP